MTFKILNNNKKVNNKDNCSTQPNGELSKSLPLLCERKRRCAIVFQELSESSRISYQLFLRHRIPFQIEISVVKYLVRERQNLRILKTICSSFPKKN